MNVLGHRGARISKKSPFLKSSESSLDVHVHTVAALTNLSREAYRFENLLPTVLLSPLACKHPTNANDSLDTI